jgi:hypothetical protein
MTIVAPQPVRCAAARAKCSSSAARWVVTTRARVLDPRARGSATRRRCHLRRRRRRTGSCPDDEGRRFVRALETQEKDTTSPGAFAGERAGARRTRVPPPACRGSASRHRAVRSGPNRAGESPACSKNSRTCCRRTAPRSPSVGGRSRGSVAGGHGRIQRDWTWNGDDRVAVPSAPERRRRRRAPPPRSVNPSVSGAEVAGARRSCGDVPRVP